MPLQNADPAASVLAHRQPALNDLAQQHVPHAVHWAILCGKALLGEGNCLLPQWEARIHQLLDDDSPDAAITELMECLPFTTSEEQLNALDDVVGYYRSNQKRMQYRTFRQRGLPVGSGIVESAHRQVLQTRMKRAAAALIRALAMEPSLARSANGVLASHAQLLRAKIDVLTAGEVPQRLATFLLQAAERFGSTSAQARSRCRWRSHGVPSAAWSARAKKR